MKKILCISLSIVTSLCAQVQQNILPQNQQQLEADWTVENPTPDAISFNNGTLILTNQGGNIFRQNDNAHNMIYRNFPSKEDCVIDLRVSIDFLTNPSRGEQGGIFFYYNKDHYCKLVYEWLFHEKILKPHFIVAREVGGIPKVVVRTKLMEAEQYQADPIKYADLKMTKRGNELILEARTITTKGTTNPYQLLCKTTIPISEDPALNEKLGEPKLGIFALGADKEANKNVHFHSLTCTPLTAANLLQKFNTIEPIPLFNGKDLTGWHIACKEADKNKTFWTATNGTIQCDATNQSEHDYVWLMSNKEYKNFHLNLKFKVFNTSQGNSGIQIRSRYDKEARDGGWLDGPQVDIHPPAPFRTGYIFNETTTNRHWIHPKLEGTKMSPSQVPSLNIPFHKEGDKQEWNTLDIICDGITISTILNGTPVAHYNGSGMLDNANHLKANVGMQGHIALQLHSKSQLKMQFRDIFIRELPSEQNTTP